MNFYQRQLLVDSGTTVVPAAEIDYDSLSRADLLSELRAMRVVLAHTQHLLDTDQRKEVAFKNLEVAYRAALDACARAEANILELRQQISALTK